jgi:hypothetical protein
MGRFLVDVPADDVRKLDEIERHGSTVDGLEYERQLREEWPDVSDIASPKKKRSSA